MDLKFRLDSSYSADAKKYIHLLSIGDTRVVGSYLFKRQAYPGDIDMYSETVECCGLEEAVKKIAERIQKIVRDVEMPDAYLADFKAGVDSVFSVYKKLGRIAYDGIGKKGYKARVVGFDRGEVMVDLLILVEGGFLSEDEFKEMKKYMSGSVSDFIALSSLLKEKYVLRWSREEIMKGVKKLIGGRELRLEDALKAQSLVKIDIWAWVDNRYQEMSNFMILFYSNDGKDAVKINKSQPDFLDAVRNDIQMFWSEPFFDPYKALKRMWIIARIEGDNGVLRKINKMLDSGMARTKQVVDDMESIVGILKKFKKKDILMHRIRKEIDEFKVRLAYVEELDFNVDKLLDKAVKGSVKNIIEILEGLRKYLKVELNKEAYKFALRNALYPPSSIYLPIEMVGGCMDCYRWVLDELDYDGDEDELLKGIMEEREHSDISNDPVVWGKIALAHLKEDPKYYSKLEKCMGGGVFKSVANAYRRKKCGKKSRPLKEGEYHFACANFEGPGTRIDLKEVRDFPAYNKVDECAKEHDIAYWKSKNEEDIRKADEKFMKCISGEKGIYAKVGRAGIGSKMKLEDWIPFIMKKMAGEYYGGSEIQSVLFSKDMWNKKDAKKWIKKHGYIWKKVDEKGDYYRVRQTEPNYKKYRTIEFGDGIKGVLGL